jgi:hypothetical protein
MDVLLNNGTNTDGVSRASGPRFEGGTPSIQRGQDGRATAGWQILFDGSDLSKWQNCDGGKPSAGWVIEDGVLTRKPNAGMIWTKERFGDFILVIEFKTEGNSGIFLRL